MFIKLLISSLPTFLAIDSIWIYFVASPWMKKAVPHLMSSSPNLLAALGFYIIYLGVLIYLILLPALAQKSAYPDLTLRSFLFGLAAYATYDLTNLAVMRGFPVSMALADMIWGGCVTTITTLIIYKLNV
jgi:uncharacterized membrane protein